MSREELIKILEDYEIFVDDDFGGSYKSIIAYTPDKKISRSHTPIGTLKIIDTFKEIQNQNKKYKEVIDEVIEYISELDDNKDDTTCYDIDKNTRDYILSILKEVE